LPDFGNPSGHCMIGSFFYLSLFLYKYYEVGNKAQMRSVFCTAYIIKMAVTCALMIDLIFVCLSRVYLGAHSYDQVIFGTSLGVVLIFILHFFASDRLKNFVQELKVPKKGNVSSNVSKVVLLMTFLVTLVLPLLLSYCLWKYKLAHHVPNEEWNQRIRTSCNMMITEETYYDTSFFMSGIICMTSGALFGTFFEIKCVKINLADDTWHQSALWKTALRVAISYSLLLIFGLPLYLMDVKELSKNTLPFTYFCFCLPTFLYLFFLFGISRKLFQSLRLINVGAIGKDYVNDSDSTGSKSRGSSLEFVEMEMADQSKQ